MRDKAFQFTETLTKRLEYKLPTSYAIQKFTDSTVRDEIYLSLTIIVIITIIKNKHLLSVEIFMETF